MLTLFRTPALILTLGLAPIGASAQTEAEITFAREYLDGLQARSFRNNREYCGFFAYDRKSKLVAIKPRSGDKTSCTTYWPRADVDVFASYHTHGSWDKFSDGEVPSTIDMETDMEDGLHGYISTPGGRFWFIDGEAGTARLLCGQGCLLTDPDYRPSPEGSIPDSFTLHSLRERQGEW